MEVRDFEGTGYMVSNLGYMVLKLGGTWFQEYRYIVSRVRTYLILVLGMRMGFGLLMIELSHCNTVV